VVQFKLALQECKILLVSAITFRRTDKKRGSIKTEVSKTTDVPTCNSISIKYSR
jgi:hypothetical protein